MNARQEDARRSMALLDALIETEEPAYRAARSRAGAPEGSPRRRAMTALTCSVIGVVLATGSNALTLPAGARDEHRDRLQDTVVEAQGRQERLTGERDTLRAEVADLREKGSGRVDRQVDEQIDQAAVAAAHRAAAGPGLEVMLIEPSVAPSGDGSRNPSGIADERVQPQDLQVFVNELWRGGAEAVAINGLRLSSLSTIRFAGAAIIVDFTPLAPPYTITAVGNRSSLVERFRSGNVTRHTQTLQRLGITVRTTERDSVEIPAAASGELRSARPVTTETTGGHP